MLQTDKGREGKTGIHLEWLAPLKKFVVNMIHEFMVLRNKATINMKSMIKQLWAFRNKVSNF